MRCILKKVSALLRSDQDDHYLFRISEYDIMSMNQGIDCEYVVYDYTSVKNTIVKQLSVDLNLIWQRI